MLVVNIIMNRLSDRDGNWSTVASGNHSDKTMQGFRALPRLLWRGGLDVVFSMLGGTNAPWIAQGCLGGTLSLIKTRHEETAVGAAAGYARSTGQIGLCSVTRGPGFTNAISALTAATRSHVPILLVVGESPSAHLHGTQSIDQRRLTETVGAGFHHIEGPLDLESTFWTALQAARWDGTPQVLSINSTVLAEDVTLTRNVPASLRPGAAPDSDAVAAATDLLATADYPLLLAGSGVLLADCRADVLELANLVGARLSTTLRAHRLFAGAQADLGVAGGWAPAAVRSRLAECDVVLAVGASLNDFTTDEGHVFPAAKIVHCEINPDHTYATVVPDIVLTGDARQSIRALAAEWRRRGLPARRVRGSVPTTAELIAAALDVDLGHDPRRGLDPRHVYAELEEKLQRNRVVVTDNGRFMGTLPTLLTAADAQGWLVGNSYSSIGLGLGAAIGAAVAHPDRQVVLITGDGGFMMSAHDLDAVRINGLNLVVIIMNDEQYGSDAKYLHRFGLPMDVICQDLPDIPTLARAFGGFGVVLRTAAELADLDLRRSGLLMVDARVDPEVDVREVIAQWSRHGGC